jgi:hypothetical protein
MRPIAYTMMQTGILSPDFLQELKRWGLPIEPPKNPIVLRDVEQVITMIRQALEGFDQVALRETDLDLLSRFLNPEHQKRGTLVMSEEGNAASKVTSRIDYCTTLFGEFVFPWLSEDISDLITNGLTYLRFNTEEGVTKKVKFCDAREVFFGAQKLFMVCKPVQEAL